MSIKEQRNYIVCDLISNTVSELNIEKGIYVHIKKFGKKQCTYKMNSRQVNK